MFSYYGSKSKVVHLYPRPEYGRIIEPFAGSARYSLRWFDRDVLLIDKYEVIVKVWKYLQQASQADIMGLPEPKYKESIEKYDLSEGEHLLMGFMVAGGVCEPQHTVQKFSDIPAQKSWIASQLFKIRHWEIRIGSYEDAPDMEATWFIDPPYQVGGERYKVGRYKDALNFGRLRQWCESRAGQVIVCENTKATWLPFHPMREMSGAYSQTTEAIWSNRPTDFDFHQLDIFGSQNA